MLKGYIEKINCMEISSPYEAGISTEQLIMDSWDNLEQGVYFLKVTIGGTNVALIQNPFPNYGAFLLFGYGTGNVLYYRLVNGNWIKTIITATQI